MPNHVLSYEDDGAIAVITLKRPPRNSWVDEMGEELAAVYNKLDKEDRVKVIIMTGDGPNFCAGAELGKTSPFGEGSRSILAYRDGGGIAVLAMHRCRKPTIAAINGTAVGVGATMTLAQDFRVISKNTKIGFVFNSRGITAESCSSYFLPKLVGHSNAMALIGSARVVSANHKWCQNLFTTVVDKPEEVLPEAMALARDVAKRNSMVSHAISKTLMWTARDNVEDYHSWESFALYWALQNDGKEGIQSFLEKRSPNFTGKLEDPTVKEIIHKLRARL